MSCPLCVIRESPRRTITDDEAAVFAYVHGIYAGKGPMLTKLCARHETDVQECFEQLAPKSVA